MIVPFTFNKSPSVLTSKNKPFSQQVRHLRHCTVVVGQKFNNLLGISTCLEVPTETLTP
jgi:hypothetical protein